MSAEKEGSSPPELVEEAEGPEAEALGKLGDLELEFEKAEVELMRKQYELNEGLYKRRQEIIKSIPTFWSIILDTFGPEFDQYVAPQDTVVLSYVENVDVTRPNASTEPRDFDITITFTERGQDWFDEKSLTKKFTWKVIEGEWSGLVSEPVKITWKKGKDLTNGETDRAYEQAQAKKAGADSADSKGKGKEKAAAASTTSQTNGKGKSLEDRIGGGQPSFFTWFAWKGRLHDQGGEREANKEEDEDEDVMGHGDELAITIADEIFPNAVKFFIEALNSEGDSQMSEDLDDDSGSEMLELDIDEDEDSDDGGGVGGSQNAGIKRVDIELSGSGSDSEEEDEGEARRKRIKTTKET